MSKQFVLPLNYMVEELEDIITELEKGLDNKNSEIEDLEKRNEFLVDEVQDLVAKIDNLEDEIKGWKEECAEWKEECVNRKDKIDDLDQEVSQYKSVASELNKIAYDSLVALHIMKRFISDKHKDLVNIYTMMKFKMDIDEFFNIVYNKLLDVEYSNHEYLLPEFDDKEIKNDS